jgi:hypothetical protein
LLAAALELSIESSPELQSSKLRESFGACLLQLWSSVKLSRAPESSGACLMQLCRELQSCRVLGALSELWSFAALGALQLSELWIALEL